MKKETEMSVEKVVKQPKPKLMNIKLEKLHPFENHPYKVLDDESMKELVGSIKEYGLFEQNHRSSVRGQARRIRNHLRTPQGTRR